MSAITFTIHEFEHGVLLAERTDPTVAASCAPGSTEAMAAAFAERVLPVDEAVARRAAAVHVPDPAPFRDALIGATAIVHNMTVVTRNVRGFANARRSLSQLLLGGSLNLNAVTLTAQVFGLNSITRAPYRGSRA